jgi:hypothetical protein
MPVPKKKSTGMSQRQSFLDRGVVAENRAILRYNEELEREARRAERGESAPAPAAGERGQRTGPRSGAGPRGGGPGTRSARPQRGDRPPVRREPPRAASPEQEALVRSVLPTPDVDAVLAAGGSRLVERLVRDDRLSRASDIGWETVLAAQTGERSTPEWAALRRSWAVVVDAVTEEWVKIHPDARPQRSAVAEIDRHLARQRPRPPAKKRTRKPKPGPPPTPGAVVATPSPESAEDLVEIDVAWSAAEPEPPAAEPGTLSVGDAASTPTAAGDQAPKRRHRRGRRRPRRPAEAGTTEPGAATMGEPIEGEVTEPVSEQPVSRPEAPVAEPTAEAPTAAPAVPEPLAEPMGSEVPPEPGPA